MNTNLAAGSTSRSADTLRAGVIGLGMIGGGVAKSLIRSGRTPIVYDIRADAADGLPGNPPVARTPEEVARASDIVLIAVVDAAQAHDVLNRTDGVLASGRPGLVVVLLSTVSVQEVGALAHECSLAGVSLVDCGVTPGDRAADGSMVAMVGGDDETVDKAMPVLNDFTKRVIHCGPLGAGMATKIARNVMTYGSWRATYEAGTLAKSAGVAPSVLIDVVREADPDGTTPFLWLQHEVEKPEQLDTFAIQTLRLMDKDLAAAQKLADHQSVNVPLIDTVREHARETLGVPPEEDQEHDRAAVGLKTMAAVYGGQVAESMPAGSSPTVADTIEHLFGEIWSRPGLSIRDRRLLVIGATASLGRSDLIEIQARGALLNDELSEDELQEAVLQLHYYVGWGNGTRLQEGVNAALESTKDRPQG